MRLRNIKTFKNDLFYLYLCNFEKYIELKLPQILDRDLTFENEQVKRRN